MSSERIRTLCQNRIGWAGEGQRNTVGDGVSVSGRRKACEASRSVDQKSIARFRKSLKVRQQELRNRLSERRREGVTNDPDYVKDEGGRGITSRTQEAILRQTSRDRSLLVAVTAALARVDAGTFGQCHN